MRRETRSSLGRASKPEHPSRIRWVVGTTPTSGRGPQLREGSSNRYRPNSQNFRSPPQDQPDFPKAFVSNTFFIFSRLAIQPKSLLAECRNVRRTSKQSRGGANNEACAANAWRDQRRCVSAGTRLCMIFCEKKWFRRSANGRLVPSCWQGWAYVFGCTVGAVLPLWLLLARGQPLEAAVWLLMALGGISYEVRQVLRAFRHQAA